MHASSHHVWRMCKAGHSAHDLLVVALSELALLSLRPRPSCPSHSASDSLSPGSSILSNPSVIPTRRQLSPVSTMTLTRTEALALQQRLKSQSTFPLPAVARLLLQILRNHSLAREVGSPPNPSQARPQPKPSRPVATSIPPQSTEIWRIPARTMRWMRWSQVSNEISIVPVRQGLRRVWITIASQRGSLGEPCGILTQNTCGQTCSCLVVANHHQHSSAHSLKTLSRRINAFRPHPCLVDNDHHANSQCTNRSPCAQAS